MTRFGCFVDLPCHGKYPAEPTLKRNAVASLLLSQSSAALAGVGDEQRCQPPVVTIGRRAPL